MKEGKKIIVWFRNDLRIHDHQPLTEALHRAETVIPVFCFDPRLFGPTIFHTLKTGVFRTRFLIESVSALRNKLKSKGSDLVILNGLPEEELVNLAVNQGVSQVLAYKEVAFEEIKVSDLVEEKLWKAHISMDLFLGNTLFNKEDLPVPIKDIPDTFSNFKKRVERDSHVRKCFEEPGSIASPGFSDTGDLPSLESFGFAEPAADARTVLEFRGGEEEGLKRLYEYTWEKELIRNYKSTRNGLLSADYSSKLSPWLSLGCLSPRKVYEQIKAFENEKSASTSTQGLFNELLWRDFFRFVFKKYGNKLFREKGLKEEGPFADLETEAIHFERWKNAQTGIPFVDANMRELNATGFMGNRGRLVTASFLIHDCHVTWTKGAAWFEEKLMDYNPANNWGNWAYVAGVGNNPKDLYSKEVIKQAYEIDSKGDYVKLWVPELQNLPSYLIHQPYLMTEEQQNLYGVKIGNNYPVPVVALKKFEKQY